MMHMADVTELVVPVHPPNPFTSGSRDWSSAHSYRPSATSHKAGVSRHERPHNATSTVRRMILPYASNP